MTPAEKAAQDLGVDLKYTSAGRTMSPNQRRAIEKVLKGMPFRQYSDVLNHFDNEVGIRHLLRGGFSGASIADVAKVLDEYGIRADEVQAAAGSSEGKTVENFLASDRPASEMF